jgi:hypothetical protein
MDGWRWGREEQHRREIAASRPLTRAQRIAGVQHGLETAKQIVCDIRACRANLQADPIRWAIDAMKEADKLSMLAAIGDDVRELLDSLRTEAAPEAMS